MGWVMCLQFNWTFQDPLFSQWHGVLNSFSVTEAAAVVCQVVIEHICIVNEEHSSKFKFNC